MAGGGGEWLGPALAFERRLVDLPEQARRETFAREAAARGLSRQTLRRMVAAARFVRSTAKSVALELGDVRAAVVSVEALMRLEKRNPQLASRLRETTLRGGKSFRSLLAVLEAEKRGRADWTGFALGLVDHAYPEIIDAVGFGPGRAWASETARELKVDLEVEVAGEVRAVFLSPRCELSEFSGRALSEQIPRIFMALFFYDQVTFAYEDGAEAAEVLRLRGRAAGAERLRLLSLREARGAPPEQGGRASHALKSSGTSPRSDDAW